MLEDVVVIGIEGPDGSGKKTHVELLEGKLHAQGFRVEVLDFPQYNGFFGKEIGARLKGEAPLNAAELPPKDMSIWYAVDRLQAFQRVKPGTQMILLNRSTYSNIGFQLARLPKEERAAMKEWLKQLEFSELELPIPDKVFYLDVDVEVSQALMKMRGERVYTDKQDVYEQDVELLKTAQQIYRDLVQEEPNFEQINCCEGGELLSISVIHDRIYERVLDYLCKGSQERGGNR